MFRPILVRRFSYWNMFLFRVPKPYKKATSSPTLYFPFWNITNGFNNIWIHDTHPYLPDSTNNRPYQQPHGNNPGLGMGSCHENPWGPWYDPPRVWCAAKEMVAICERSPHSAKKVNMSASRKTGVQNLVRVLVVVLVVVMVVVVSFFVAGTFWPLFGWAWLTFGEGSMQASFSVVAWRRKSFAFPDLGWLWFRFQRLEIQLFWFYLYK